MTIRKYLSDLFLIRKIEKYKRENIFGNQENEICENYYRVDDEDNDGRGLF